MRCLYSSTSGRGLCSLPLGHEGVHRFTRDISLVEQNDLEREADEMGIRNAALTQEQVRTGEFLRGARFRR